MKKLIPVLFLLVLSGCVKNQSASKDPQDVLAEYVSRTFSISTLSDKNKLVELTEGEVKKNLEKMSEGNFRKFFIDSKRTFLSLKILEKRKISDERVGFTYELAYLDKSQEKEAKIINKKICLFKKDDSRWKIDEVKNIKTFIDNTQEMTFESAPANLP